MKNYLIRSLYRIESPLWFRDRSDEGDIYEQYMQMHEISLRTFEQHLQGDWEFVFFNKTVDDIQSVFKDHFFEIYDIWRSEPCNILYCGPDNAMMKPTEFFGKYDDFMMFNYTDPKSSVEHNHYGVQHKHFFNADVRYYPSTMSKDIWDMGVKMAHNWDFNCWNTEQFILNKMLWDQPNRTLENTLDPLMAYQAHGVYPEQLNQSIQYSNSWNGCDINDSYIIHCHGSRNAPQKLELMKILEQASINN